MYLIANLKAIAGIRPTSRSYVSALEARIKTLEDVIRATAGAALLDVIEGSTALEGDDEQKLASASNLAAPNDIVPDGRLPEDNGASNEAILDVGRLGLCLSKLEEGNTTNGDSAGFCYYGPTSSRHLACIDESDPSLPYTHIECDLKRSLDTRISANLFEDKHELALLDKFWIWQDIHYTIVDRNLFLKSYNDGERDSEWVSPMLIDMMLAIGEQFGHQGHENRRAVYSTRAEATVVHELGRPRMATMQAIQLMSTFQMGAGRVSVAWSLNGLAVALSNRLGLHIDASDAVKRGIMSETMKRIRDMEFWGLFVQDRRRSLSTRRPFGGIRTSVLPGNIALAGGDPDEASPRDTLGPLEATSIWLWDLCDIVETMLVDIYAFDSPNRTPADEYNMITKNALIMQTYTENLPICISEENSIRTSNLRPICLHIFINLFVIMLNRPFLGPHHSQTAVSSSKFISPANQAIERRYRSLAFGYCRTAALRIIALVEHFIHSPCFTTAYDIFSACTVLLLSPKDPVAIKAVRTGLGYLDMLKRSYYWAEAAEDSRRRIWALAKRWNVRALLDDLGHTDSAVLLASTSRLDVNAAVQSQAGVDDTWNQTTLNFDWTILDELDMNARVPADVFAGLDTILFPTPPTADLAAMYSGLDLQTGLPELTGSWWFMGPQPPTGCERLNNESWFGVQ
ncbi:hypothetical protein FRC12_011646 [Ceratobasidium sp. 428]|nr:hypothetical protein FRC12_011646 [Ceratobasidium sp. 428]